MIPKSGAGALAMAVVLVYRVANAFGDSDYETLKKTRPSVAGYPMRREASVTGAAITKLGAILTDSKTFVPPQLRSTCLFQRGYVLRFQKGADSVDVEATPGRITLRETVTAILPP